ncbi:hypothetical protein HII31_10582 [Pseudocercospora fuligena]|uniref:Uncharacterized protein n=1 Tax=Pseudocercospora fuligena TaxID=685502 RepID=A0A8H6RBQ5_9PEZI|nr:hypothetical protein HII31_10582 [Pseudocercospora fuligena]
MRKACVPSDPEFSQAYADMTVVNPSYPPQLGKNLVFKRMRFGSQNSDHRHTVFLMPLRPKLMSDGRWDINLKIMGVKPCHESCTLNPEVFTQRMLSQFMRAWLSSEEATTEVIERQAGESNEEFERRRLAFRAAREP